MIQQLQLLCCNGATMPSNYLAQAGVIYDNNASIEAQLEKSLLRSITLLFLLTISLGLKRRTDIRFCQEALGIIAEKVFQIATYPTYLQSLNPENLASASASMGGTIVIVRFGGLNN
jgi:hypothetical protein